MDDEKFEVLWQKNRKSLLSEDREWQQLFHCQASC